AGGAESRTERAPDRPARAWPRRPRTRRRTDRTRWSAWSLSSCPPGRQSPPTNLTAPGSDRRARAGGSIGKIKPLFTRAHPPAPPRTSPVSPLGALPSRTRTPAVGESAVDRQTGHAPPTPLAGLLQRRQEQYRQQEGNHIAAGCHQRDDRKIGAQQQRAQQRAKRHPQPADHPQQRVVTRAVGLVRQRRDRRRAWRLEQR